MMSRLRIPILCSALLFALAIAPAMAGQFKAGGTMLNVKTRTLADMHFVDVVRQSLDLSCGAATMATVLKYFYGQDVSEGEIIEAMVDIGDAEKIQKHGFSMLELKKFAESRGYVSEGFRIEEIDKLNNLKIPVITLIDTRGYKHFVVLKDIVGDKAIIADPAFGNTVKDLKELEEQWNNVILAVLSEEQGGKEQFARDMSVRAPVSEITLLINRGAPAFPRSPGLF